MNVNGRSSIIQIFILVVLIGMMCGAITPASASDTQGISLETPELTGDTGEDNHWTAEEEIDTSETTTPGEALDAPDLTWRTPSGEVDWVVVTDCGVKGGSCAKNGEILDYDETGIETDVTGPGTLTFSWNVSCSDCDGLYFSDNGKDQENIYGTDKVWADVTYHVESGDHTLRWYYIRMDWDEPEGENCGWLDNVTYSQVEATDFSADTGCGMAPLKVRFTDLSTKNPDSYEWDFGDSETSTEQNPAHTYQNAGKYDVSLTVQREGQAQTETKSKYISVFETITPGEAVDAAELEWTSGGDKEWSAEIGAEYVNSSCGRSGGMLTSHQSSWMQTGVEGPGTLTFDWEAIPGTVMGMPMGELVFSIDNAGQYDNGYKKISFKGWRHEAYKIGNGMHTLNWTYSTRTTDKEENGGFLDNVTFIYGVDIPVADFSTNVTENRGFAPLDVQFTDTSSEFPISWNWDFSDEITSTEQNPVHTFNKPGDYTVSLTVTNINDTNITTKPITVIEPISIGRALDAEELEWSTGGDAEWFADLYTSVKGGTSMHNGIIDSNGDHTWIQANVTGPGVLTYDWKISSPSSTYDGQIEFSVNGDVRKSIKGKQKWGDWTTEYFEIPPGKQEFRWEYTNGYDFTPEHCGNLDNVTYTFGAINPTANFTANKTREMAPASISFKDSSAGCPVSWNWDFGDGTSSAEQNPAHNYIKAGNYKVTLTVANDAGTSTKEETIDIVPYTTIKQALDSEELEWTTGGDSEWSVEINNARKGNMSARSGDDLARFTCSWIQTNATGPGILNFSWIISASPTYDTLTLFDNGVEQMHITGYPENWTDVNYNVKGGKHTFRWTYERTSYSIIGENCAWLDNVSFTQFDAADFGADVTYGPVALTVNFTDYTTGKPTAWMWDFGDRETSTEQNPTHTYTHSGIYNVKLTVQKEGGEQIETKTGYITVTPPLGKALDAPMLYWTTGGDAAWYVVMNDTFKDGSCGRTGEIERHGITWIKTTVQGPARVLFDWNVSSESGYSIKSADALGFSVDGEVKEEIAGTKDGWQTVTCKLEDEKDYVLNWSYEKRAYSSDGKYEDCGWLDNFTVSDIIPVVSLSPEMSATATGDKTKFNVILNNAQDGLKKYSLNISLDKAGIAQIANVEFPEWTGSSGKAITEDYSVQINATDVNDQIQHGSKNIQLATITLKGLSDGISGISATECRILSDTEQTILPDTIPGTIEIVHLNTFPGMELFPKDSNMDGLYEDINGDGICDMQDVVGYFRNIEWIPSNEKCCIFDYNKNGQIEFDDIISLSKKISSED